MEKRSRTEKEQAEFERIKREMLAHLDRLLAKEHDKGVFYDYALWADIIHNSVMDFYEYRGYYPNILLAKETTYRKLERYFDLHPEIGVIDKDKSESGHNFISDDYSLFFCIDTERKLKLNEFKLLYDEDIYDEEETDDSEYENYVANPPSLYIQNLSSRYPLFTSIHTVRRSRPRRTRKR